jgi:NitT/TauT family transport system ATP-binding protein
MEARELISIRNVSHGYDLHGEDRIILNDINLEVKRGEFITIVGITGSGKSTLLKLILGVVKPISGEIKIEGKVVAKPNKEVGIVFQKYSLFENRTAKENVLLGLQLGNFNLFRFLKNIFKNGDTKRGLENRAKLFLDKVGLKDHGDKYPYQLSGGMRQRISIAQTLITEPKLLISY